MGSGHEKWYFEGTKGAWVWATDNIKMDLERIGWRSFSFVQDRDRWWDI